MKPRHCTAALCAVVALALVAPAAANKRSKELSADAIVTKMIDQDPLGFGGAEAQVMMVLVNNRNQERRRRFVTFSRTDDDVRRSFVRFTEPADISGTAFLGIDDGGNRVQHLFMPALSRTRRISGAQRNASFVGTDYSFADLDLRDIKDSRKRKLADERVGNRDCYVIEAAPTDSSSEYRRIMIWIDKSTWLPLRIRFFDGQDAEIKRLTVQGVKRVDGRSIIEESRMVDLKKEHTTVLRVIEVRIRDDIPLDQFTVRALERG
jgi:uncharacterized protein